jgi:hypothetical protein
MKRSKLLIGILSSVSLIFTIALTLDIKVKEVNAAEATCLSWDSNGTSTENAKNDGFWECVHFTLLPGGGFDEDIEGWFEHCTPANGYVCDHFYSCKSSYIGGILECSSRKVMGQEE